MAKLNLEGLAERLRIARLRMVPAMHQKDVGKLLERSGPCIGQWELGHTEPGLSDLKKLANIYGVATEWLMGLDSQATSHTKATIMASDNSLSYFVPLLSSSAVIHRDGDMAQRMVEASIPFKPGQAFAWSVDTDAMQRSTCAVGDIVIVEHDLSEAHHGIYLLMTDDGELPTLRRCERDQGKSVFVADGKSFSSFSSNSVRVIGRVREVIKRRLL
ncbi:MAG: S24 family peptidase [Telluria sp.]